MLPDVRRLNREDFQDAPQWLDPMLNTLNSFMDSVYNIFNRNVSLTDNLNIQLTSISVETDANGDITPVKIKTTVRGRANGIVVIRAVSNSGNSQAPFVDYVQSENIITISKIAGLNLSTKYKIIMLVIGE